MWRTGVDIGGTFTDIVFLDEESGELRVTKVLTTPKRPSQAVLLGLGESGVDLSDISTLVHATTLGTNMFLGQEGLVPPKVALITTKGFRDVLEIGRQRRPELYNLYFEKPPPLVKRRDRYEVEERIDAWGNVITPLNEKEAAELADQLCQKGYEVVAISFLHSYINPVHEERMLEILRERCPELDVILSSRVNPEHKEYERTSTTVVN
ncbi:MAG TPA: hydantoinase/oxoprolinase family protein, partial [Candidatus Korarchaeota archaeon]|nr:hydantoinase/oxoprolinase family protein [Candidatus Korarchaeota archaeon]